MTGAAADDADLDAFLAEHGGELRALRRHLHAYPELSGSERETTDLVAQRLRAAGLAPRLLAGGTGLWCDVGEGPPSVVLRADLDALAMDDEKEVPYRSQVPGVAHACGHDVHTVVVLGAGLALARAEGAGGVRLVFEPSEETVPGGAVDVIREGGLDGIRYVFGLHCDPKVDVGRIGVRAGAITAAADALTVRLHGPGGHTARPHLTVDLVAVAGRVAAELPVRVQTAAGEGAMLLVFGALHAGEAANVIPATAELRGSVRVPERALWDEAHEIVATALGELVAPTGATWELDYRRGVPPVVNDVGATELLAAGARDAVVDAAVVHAPRSTGGDSFAWYLERVAGSYARLGVHDPAATGPRLDLHASTFDIDERAIDVGVRALVHTARRALAAPPPDHSPRP